MPANTALANDVPPATLEPAGIVSGLSVRQLLRASSERGLAPGRVGARALAAHSLDFAEPISAKRAADVWCAAARELGREVPWLAASSGHSEQSPLVFCLLGSANARQMMQDWVRFSPLVSSEELWHLEENTRPPALDVHSSRTDLGGRLLLEFHVLELARVFLQHPTLRKLIRGLTFAHPCPAAVYAKGLGIPVRDRAERTGIELHLEMFDAPLAADSDAADFLRPHLETLLKTRQGLQSLEDRVRAWVAWVLPEEPTIEGAAWDLGWAPRTLQRRLGEEGIRYRDLVAEVRFELACEWLPTSTATEVAYRLGYSDVRAFNRAFRRWSGHTPSRWARDVRGATLELC